MKESVLVLGSCCVDVLIRVEHLPKREEDLQPLGQRFRPGGCAYNAAHLLGVNGADVTFVTPVGLRGVFGPFLLPLLRSQPWVKPVVLPLGENGCCYCLVEPGGERSFLSVHGVEYSFDPAWIAEYSRRRFDWCYVCGLEVEEATGGALVDWLERAAVGRILYAPGPRLAQIPAERARRMLALRPVLHLNLVEALQLSGAPELSEASARLYAATGQPVVITLGQDGAAVRDRDSLRLIPPCPAARVVDTVGAGDAHAGALLLGLSSGMTLDESAALANRAAARVVATEGATLDEKLNGF